MKTNIRKFCRNIYFYLDKLPVTVYNLKTDKVVFIVIPPRKLAEGLKEGEKNEIRAKNTI